MCSALAFLGYTVYNYNYALDYFVRGDITLEWSRAEVVDFLKPKLVASGANGFQDSPFPIYFRELDQAFPGR